MKSQKFFVALVVALCAVAGMNATENFTTPEGIVYQVAADGSATIVMGDQYYWGDVVVPESVDGHTVTTIGFAAFNGCHGLKSVVVPATVTKIDAYAFNSCDSLTAIVLPDNVVEIGEHAFHACKRITAVELPAALTSLGDEAFFGCEALKTVTMGKNLTHIGERVFQRCTQMKTFTVDEENPQYKSVEGNLFNKQGSVLVDFARKCTNYRIYEIPETVKEIKPFAFYGCDAMKSVVLPEGLTTIGDWAWGNASLLSEFTLPASVTSVGKNAFYGMKALKTFICKTEQPLALDSLLTPFGMFTDMSARTLVVPTQDAVELYSNAPVWKDFGTIKFEGSGVTEVAMGQLVVKTQGLNITVKGVDDTLVTLYDINGAVVKTSHTGALSAPAAGFYVLKVGEQAVKLSLAQ